MILSEGIKSSREKISMTANVTYFSGLMEQITHPR